MLKLLKNLKKTWVSVVIIVILLCVQAWADLTLPDYTSKIVNTGIQAGGIENVSPDEIRVSSMEDLLMFTNNKEEILQNYTKEDNMYKLKNITKQERKNLDAIMARPIVIACMLTQDDAQNMSEEEAIRFADTMNQTIDETLGTMVEQAAISLVKEIYKANGVDTDAIQNRYIIKIGLQMLGVALISMISAISIMFLSSRVAAMLGKTLRDKVFKKVLGFSRRRI